MDGPLDEEYLVWLYSQVGAVKLRNRSKSYWSLSRQLFKTEFFWFVPHDDNRAEDGKDLRYEFLDACGLDAPDEWLQMGCSMLELLIAISRRLAFETEGQPRVWFWHLIEVLDLKQYNDRAFDDNAAEKVEEVLNGVIFRLYEPSGRGGLFPLNRPRQDQREVELWYQLSAYLLELM
jgi:hypothetical protein